MASTAEATQRVSATFTLSSVVPPGVRYVAPLGSTSDGRCLRRLVTGLRLRRLDIGRRRLVTGRRRFDTSLRRLIAGLRGSATGPRVPDA